MRSRAVLLIVAILLIAGFAALNWAEVIRPSPLLFGPILMDAPLGAILLGLLALSVVIFAVSAGAIRTQALMESRQHHKSLEAQRELADKAEASRFTDLRTHLDTQLRELRDRDAISATELQRSVVESQRELRTQLEQINRTLAARVNELEHRIDTRLGQASGGHAVVPARAVTTAPVLHDSVEQREAELREQRLRQEQVRTQQQDVDARMQQERVREDLQREERAVAATKPVEGTPQSGWRKWF